MPKKTPQLEVLDLKSMTSEQKDAFIIELVSLDNSLLKRVTLGSTRPLREKPRKAWAVSSVGCVFGVRDQWFRRGLHEKKPELEHRREKM